MYTHNNKLLLACVSLTALCLSLPIIAMDAIKNKAAADILSQPVTKEDLLKLISRTHADGTTKDVARTALDRIYETKPRYVRCPGNSTKYGWALPCNPEILAEVMTLSKGKKVLELAAASGENALCFGLAGAEEVYVNEMEPAELEDFEKSLKSLPENLQRKFHTVPGDCLEVFADETYTGYFDVIYARHVFHFFLGEKRDAFMRLLGRLLKPGGRLILTVNSVQRLSKIISKRDLQRYPEAYVFARRTPKLRLLDKYFEFSLGEATPVVDVQGIDPLAYYHEVAARYSQEGEILFRDGIHHLTPENQQQVITALKQVLTKNNLADLLRDDARVVNHVCHVVAYSQRTIQGPFVKAGFKVAKLFSTDYLGHVIVDQEVEAAVTGIFEKQAETTLDKASITPQSSFICAFCTTPGKKLCSRCKNVHYCSDHCQKKHWPTHKITCKAVPQTIPEKK